MIDVQIPARPGTYFSWEELKVTNTGLPNEPPVMAMANLVDVVAFLLDPLREALGVCRVTSGYRSRVVNSQVGGSPRSLHMEGRAVDFTIRGMASRDVVARLVESGLPFDQAIWYDASRGGHVHVSLFPAQEGGGRRQALHAVSTGGYVPA